MIIDTADLDYSTLGVIIIILIIFTCTDFDISPISLKIKLMETFYRTYGITAIFNCRTF